MSEQAPIQHREITALRIVQAFAGPSLHAPRSALRLRLSLAASNPAGSAIDVLELQRQIVAAMPGIDPSLSVPAPVSDAATATTGMAVGRVAVLLQRWLGHDVTHCASLSSVDEDRDHEEIVLEHRVPELAWSAVRTAAELCASAGARAGPSRVAELLGHFRQRNAGDVLHHAVRIAEQRGIPWRTPVAQQGLYELGQGMKLRRIWRNFTPDTTHIGTMIASRKHLATALLRRHGLPVPRNFLVGDDEGALRAAKALGGPVVVKPERTDFGTAVSVNLTQDADIRRAFAEARRHGPVLVEQMVAGDNHRLLVMAGRFVSAVRQTPAQVVGDGVHSVRALVELANRTRTEHLSVHWKKITIDDHVLAVLRRQDLALDDVPPPGRAVRLRSASNLSMGGTMMNVTAQVHADNRALVERAAAVTRLDVAGVDFITLDITRSYHEVGGAICEINPTPGFTMGEAPGYLERLYFDGLFGLADNGRIDTIVILEPDEAGPAERDLVAALQALLATRLARSGIDAARQCPSAWVGVAAHGQVRVGDQRLVVGGDAGHVAGVAFEQLLMDPRVGSALLALNARTVAERGLPLDRCSVVLISGSQAAQESGASAAAQRQAVVRLLSHVADAVIVASDDPHEPDTRSAARRCVVHASDAPVAAWIEATEAALVEAAGRMQSR